MVAVDDDSVPEACSDADVASKAHAVSGKEEEVVVVGECDLAVVEEERAAHFASA